MPRFSTYAELQAFLAELGAGDDSLFTGGVAETPSNMLLNTLPATRTAVATSTVLPSSGRQAVRVTAKAIDTIKTLNVTSQASTATQLLTKEQIDSLLLGAALNVPASATDGKWLANSQGTSLFNSTMWSNQPPARLAVVLEAPSGIYGKAIATGVYTNLPSYKVYYTLDGSEPTDKSLTIAQNEKIQINGDVSTNVTLKVLVVDASGLTDNFGRTEATYTIEEYIDISTSAYWVNAGIGQPTQAMYGSQLDQVFDWSWWQGEATYNGVGYEPTNPNSTRLVLLARKSMYWRKLRLTLKYSVDSFETGLEAKVGFFRRCTVYNNIATPVIDIEQAVAVSESEGEVTVTLENVDLKLEAYIAGIQLCIVGSNGLQRPGTIALKSAHISLRYGTETSFTDANNLGWTAFNSELDPGFTDNVGNWLGCVPDLPGAVPKTSGTDAQLILRIPYNTIASQQIKLTIEDIPIEGIADDSEYTVLVNGFRLLKAKVIDSDSDGSLQQIEKQDAWAPPMGSKRVFTKLRTVEITVPLIAGPINMSEPNAQQFKAWNTVGIAEIIVKSSVRNFYLSKVELSTYDGAYLQSLYKGYGPNIHEVGEPWLGTYSVNGQQHSFSTVFDGGAYTTYALTGECAISVDLDEHTYHAMCIVEQVYTRLAVGNTYTVFDVWVTDAPGDWGSSLDGDTPGVTYNIAVYAIDPKTSTDRYVQLGQYSLNFEFP